MAAGNALPAPVTAAASRGYDASQKVELAPATPFDKTTVMNKTGAPERPQAGARNTGQEP
jgi:eukaryotic-like serine/threonine-protein kinase